MSKIITIIMMAINLCFFVALCFIWGSAPSGVPATANISYETYLSLSLSVMQVILGALGIALGLIAIFGYVVIRDKAVDAARLAAQNAAESKVSDLVSSLVPKLVYEKLDAYGSGAAIDDKPNEINETLLVSRERDENPDWTGEQK